MTRRAGKEDNLGVAFSVRIVVAWRFGQIANFLCQFEHPNVVAWRTTKFVYFLLHSSLWISPGLVLRCIVIKNV